MRFTLIATLLMIGATIGVTPGLRLDLMQMLEGAAPAEGEAAHAAAGQRLSRIPDQVLDSLPEAQPESTEPEPVRQRLTVELNDLSPAAGPGAGEASPAQDIGAVQVAALPPGDEPLHDTEILRLSDLAPAAPHIEAPEDADRARLDPQGFALFVAIGSYESLREAAKVVRRHADWDPMIHKAVLNERLRHVVVLGPFESDDVGAVLERLREAGVAEPWPLAVQLRPGLSLKSLDIFG